ncbi:protein phosphatase 2C domain-containing protein [Kineosporia sp. NBRC 101677]|uniref:PP2C family protein-serine/threonine phosphatase n=1 Tax=Kineosporia sp. NBRC 101677 TaxID=3032197 RepID=UPI002553C258|nr:protein phosphatase 2C domain-containing protein [Kineosporia sp. NBRC 101677]
MRRTNNEDSGFIGRRLFLVADGMGGHDFGEVASAIVARTVAYLDDHLSLFGPERDIVGAVEFADQRLARAIENNPSLSGMGTTLTAMLIHHDTIALTNVGDSRAYLLRGREMYQLTHDDTYVQMLADKGWLDPKLIPQHPQRSVLLRVLRGGDDGGTAEVSVHEAVPGDRYLLCSDGLSDYVPAEAIQKALAGNKHAGKAIDKLIALALKAGAPDNVTCVVGDVVDDDVKPTGDGEFVGSAQELGEGALEAAEQKVAEARAAGYLKSA